LVFRSCFGGGADKISQIPPRSRPASEKAPQKVNPEDAAQSLLFAQANAAPGKLARAGAMPPTTDVRTPPYTFFSDRKAVAKPALLLTPGSNPC